MTDMPDGYAIRLAIDSDLPALQEVDLDASRLFEPTGLIVEEDGPTAIPLTNLMMGLDQKLLFVVTSPFGDAVGFALASERKPDLYLDQISVSLAHGKRGLGAALLYRIIEEADRRGLSGVVLSTFRDLPWNGPFYARHGFVELPQSRLKGWMRALEKIQSESMDVSLRCFMRRPGAQDGKWIRRPQKNTADKATENETGV